MYFFARSILFLLPFAHRSLSIPADIQCSAQCTPEKAHSILQDLSDGKPFCSALVPDCCPITKKETTTVSQTQETCQTKTVHSTEHSDTLTITVEYTLPVTTVTIYSSTVLVPKGNPPKVDKRSQNNNLPRAANPAPTPTNIGSLTTPTALAAYSPAILAAACSSLLTPACSTTTATHTITTKIPCTSTTTDTTTKYKHTTTSTETNYPGPDLVFKSKTLTTTVPAACASNPYLYNGDPPIPDTRLDILGYPYFPQTAVECCVFCHQMEKCIASAFIVGSLSCQILSATADQGEGASKKCPLGIYDFPFGKQKKKKGNVYPGPCGK